MQAAEFDGSFANALRERTRALHTQAEQAGIVHDILRGRVSRFAYALYLRNILPAYRQLEAGLERHRHSIALQGIARREVYRASALQADLEALCGIDYASAIPLVPAADRYARHLAVAADKCSEVLIAHAYTRFLGDLNGGRMMGRVLARSFATEAPPLQFYCFPAIPDLAAFTAQYRRAFDVAGVRLAKPEFVLSEAELAFAFNIDLSIEVQEAAMSAAEDAGSS